MHFYSMLKKDYSDIDFCMKFMHLVGGAAEKLFCTVFVASICWFIF